MFMTVIMHDLNAKLQSSFGNILITLLSVGVGVVLARRSIVMVNDCLKPLCIETLNLLFGDGFDVIQMLRT